MKRRKILKLLGITSLSLTGLERLAKAVVRSEKEGAPLAVPKVPICAVAATPSPAATYLCETTTFVCGDNETSYVCDTNGPFGCGYFRCQPTEGDFNCSTSYTGCQSPGDFWCQGSDPQGEQFNCSLDFDGCAGEDAVFRCDDFNCAVSYSCGSSNTCTTQYPFICSLPYTA